MVQNPCEIHSYLAVVVAVFCRELRERVNKETADESLRVVAQILDPILCRRKNTTGAMLDDVPLRHTQGQLRP